MHKINPRGARRPVLFAACLAVAAMAALFSAGAFAQNDAAMGWTEYKSKIKLFRVRMPKDYRAVRKPMRTGEKTVIYSEDVTSIIDQRPYKNIVKNYAVRYDQTFGNPFGEEEARALIERALNTYAEQFSPMEGVLRAREISESCVKSYLCGKIHITYKDPELGEQSLRAVIFYTNSGKFEQVLMGPDSVMYNNDAKNFFESLSVNEGVNNSEGNLEKKWTLHETPLKMFDQYLPPVSTIYMPQEARITGGTDGDTLRATFRDPSRSQLFYYNVFSYVLKNPLKLDEAETLILNKHVAKYLKTPKKTKIEKRQDGDTFIYTIDTPINAPKDFPYITSLRVKMHFRGNVVVVQEAVGNPAHTKSLFAESLIKMMKFYPGGKPPAETPAQSAN